jgi:hypothetical protein
MRQPYALSLHSILVLISFLRFLLCIRCSDAHIHSFMLDISTPPPYRDCRYSICNINLLSGPSRMASRSNPDHKCVLSLQRIVFSSSFGTLFRPRLRRTTVHHLVRLSLSNGEETFEFLDHGEHFGKIITRMDARSTSARL